jgi:hypothetical protein
MSEVMARLAAEGELKASVGLTAVALAVERQAKINASNGEHPYRTPTPSPGDPEGPARISGSLVRSITHSGVERTAIGWAVKVGMAPGLYPYYDRRTSSSMYAYYLEVTGVGKSRKRFPFLVPALRMVGRVSVYTIYKEIMGAAWGVG